MSKFDWAQFPTYNINVSKLNTPYDICNIFDCYKIDKYVYRIMFKGIVVVKFGMSAPKGGPRGERVYRQIAHAYSWGPHRISGSSGSDWLEIEQDFKRHYEVDLDHKDLTITVWDVSNYAFQSFNPFKEVEAMESEKIDEHIRLLGQKPIGNINDEANKRNRSYISKSVYNSIFIEAVECE